MQEYRRLLDIEQGYNFNKTNQSPVGFLVKAKIAGTEMAADQGCKNPLIPDQDLKVVAVLDDVQWNVNATSAVLISGRISAANRQTLSSLIYKELVSCEVLFEFSVCDYDPIVKKYYPAFHSNKAEMKGLFEKLDNKITINVDADPATEVQSPLNYRFSFGVVPQDVEQALHIATADQKTVVKTWGMKR